MGAVALEELTDEFVYAAFECRCYDEEFTNICETEKLLHVFSDLYSAQMYFEFWKVDNDEKPTKVTIEWLHPHWDNQWYSPKELNENDDVCYTTYVIRKIPVFTYKKEV